MAQRNHVIFQGLHVISWIIFVGLCVETGGLLVNFVCSIFKPEVIGSLYQKLDLSEMYGRSKWAFYGMYSFILLISFLKAFLFYIVISLMHKIDLSNPFSSLASEKIIGMSYCTFSVGLISLIGRQTAKNLEHHGYTVDDLNPFWADSQAFILMAAVIYIIAVIFKKGVEIQNENNLTV